MLLGAFLDAGLPLETLQAALKGLPVVGYELKLAPFKDQGITLRSSPDRRARAAFTQLHRYRRPARNLHPLTLGARHIHRHLSHAGRGRGPDSRRQP